jgi:hypothetical protein
LRQMYSAFDLVSSLASAREHIIPGHDPQVMQRFPPARPGLKDIVVRIA